MPSLLRRLTRISFRSEMLIINLLGLVNSTLDWVPLKWSSEVESVGSLPLTKESFAFNTISADRIRSILTWIVLAKVLVDNLHIVSYFSNIYAVITWSRPLLLIPWILFSFFKNFILEVLIFAIGILLALEERLPLFLVIEFVIVKVVQFNLASYTWYWNTRLYLFLKCRDRLLQLRKGARSGSTATNGLNYSPRLRSKSLTTLMSYESSNSNEFSDSASRIFNAPDLTPMEKTMKVLGVSEKDVREARNRKQEQQFRAPTSSTDMNVPSTAKSRGLTDLNTEQCSVETANTNRGGPEGKRIEDKTASFYFLDAPADLPLVVSNVAQWSERVSSITRGRQPIGKTIGVLEAPKHEIKERSTMGAAKNPSHSRTTVLSSITKTENFVQEPVCGSSIGHMDKMPSNPEVVEKFDPQQESSVTFTSTKATERPCTSVMRKKEQKLCSAKSGIGECPIGKCMNPPEHSETGTPSSNQTPKSDNAVPENKQMPLCKNLDQAHKTTEDTPRNKEHSNPQEEVDLNNGQRSGEATAVNSSIFFDANDKSFAKDEEECDDDLSSNNSRVKRKLCHVKDLKCETSRKMQKVEECSSTPSVTAERMIETAENDTNGIDRCQMSEGRENDDAVPTAAQIIISSPKSSGSGTGVVLTGDIVITENVAADFENALVTRQLNYAEVVKLSVSERYQTQLGKLKSPNTKPRKTFYSQQANRPTFYTSPKIQAREVENWPTAVRICRRRLPRNNPEDILNNNVGNQLDSQSSNSSNVTVRPDRQRKDSGVLKPKSENIGLLPENTCALNFKNVTIRNPLTSRSLGTSYSIGSKTVPTKDKKSANEGRQMASTGVTGIHSSAARAARFKEVKANRASKEVILSQNTKDSMQSQQKANNLLNSASLTDAGNTGLLDHWDKENIYSPAPFIKDRLESVDPVFYTGALNTASHKSQDVILMNAEGFDDIDRQGSARKKNVPLQEAEVRRRLTKFSTSKEEEGESSISAICSQRIEGQQQGKDLVRTLAKEDVRNVVSPRPSASTSTDPKIKEPSQYQMVITDKFHSDENSTISENSSSAVNSVVMESAKEQQGTSVSMAESIEENSFDGDLNNTVTRPASFDEPCFSSSIHDLQDKVNVVMKTVDRLEKKMDLSEIIDHATTIENIEKKNDSNDESSQNFQSINKPNVNESINEIDKVIEICNKEEPEGSQSVDLHRLEESDKVIDRTEKSCKNEEIHTGFDVVQPESSVNNDIKDLEPHEIMKRSESDDNNHQLVAELEKVLGTIEYNNTQLPDANVIEKEIQPSVLKIDDHLETCEKPLAEATEEVKSEGKCGTSPIISISPEAIPKTFLKFKSPTTEIPEETTPEEEATSIPPNEELEEPLEVVDTTNVPEPRLPLTTIALFFILVMNFYLNYFYRNIIKPVFTYILSSIFLTIFSLVVGSRSSPLVPLAEVEEVEECVELTNNENEDLPKMKNDLFSSEDKSEVEEGVDTEPALSPLVKDEEPMNSDCQPAHSANTEQTTSEEEEVGHPRMCEMNQPGVVNALHNPLFQDYRNRREDESDVEDSFRCLKKTDKLVTGERSIPLGNDSIQMTGSEHEGHEVATQMAKMIDALHLSDSEASIDTMQSDSAKDTSSLGQASSFEEFRQDSISQAESQV